MIVVKEIKPLFTNIVTTMNKYVEAQYIPGTQIIDTNTVSGGIKEYQKVIAVGTCVRDIKPGDVVLIDPTRYGIRQHREGSLKDGVITDNPITTFNFNVVEMNGEQYLLLQDRDIQYVISKYELTDEDADQLKD
jgi:hypothetical protein